jgi:hypothetical protein
MHLNNWLQSRYGNTNHVTYEWVHYGPEESGYWMAISYCADFCTIDFQLSPNWLCFCLVDNVEYGRGTGRTKAEATDNAAELALNALRG